MRILLVDDDEEVANFLKRGFEAEGFVIDATGNGEFGSVLSKTNDYDIIILDNILPGKQGIEICKEIRLSGKTTPILMLSIQSDIPIKVALLNIGADDYVCKPYSFAELLSRVKALLRRPRKFLDQLLIVGDLVLDSDKSTVKRNNKFIHLSKKEFQMLEYLMRNKEKPVSRNSIMESVWDMNADPFSNTIETHIFSLRKKIDGPNQIKLIHTLRGRGYKVGLSS